MTGSTSKTTSANDAATDSSATPNEPTDTAPKNDDLVRCTVDADGIAEVRLGRPDESVVTFTTARITALETTFDRLAGDARVRAVIVTGPGPGMFCAGADIQLIQDITEPRAGAEAAARGRAAFARLQNLSVPVVAAIEGPCLGGGFELALFCDVRVASTDRSTKIGLPETKLGIIPGFGGTYNLSRLVGLPIALDLILAGKLLPAKPALKRGLVDRAVPTEKLRQAAREECQKLIAASKKSPRRRLRGSAWWLSRTPLRGLVVRAVTKKLSQGQARFYPAPKAALQCCFNAFALPRDQALNAEAEALGAMIVTPESKALTHLFFLTERSKRLGKDDAARPVERAFVVGGGIMGAGIAGLMAGKGRDVRLCDLDLTALAKAKARLAKDLGKRVKRRRLAAHEAQATQDRLMVSTEWGSLSRCDLWLEAVVEDMAVKQRLMAQAVANGLPREAIIATNTSSLSVTEMAENVVQRDRVVGLHFFNPPEKMPLVEVIRGEHTSAEAVATACRLAVELGKFPVVTTDAPGFLVNRCLSPYLNEAARLLLEGSSPEAIDAAMLDFGMPMGPCRLLDEVGFDVAAKVSEVMQAGFPDRMEPCDLFGAMARAGALGQKSGGGIYAANGRGTGPGRRVIEQLRGDGKTPGREASRSELVQRLIYPLVDEAYRCLDSGVVSAEQDLDLGLVMGIGFPPFTGGITRYARREGLSTIVAALDELTRTLGPRFAVSDGLRRRALD